MLPKISLIMPSYNQSRYIRSAINSILCQGYPNLEFIIMDGGSTDATIEILRSYGEKITWVSKKDDGQVDALNQGVKSSSGDIIGLLNSDDLLAPGALWKVARWYIQYPDSAWITGDYVIINSDGNRIGNDIRAFKFIQRKLAAFFPMLWPLLLGINNPIAQPSTFWRRSAHEKVGPFNKNYHYVMDYDYWLRLLKIQPPTVTSEQLSFFRVHSQSKGGGGYRKQFAEQLLCSRKHNVHKALLWLQEHFNRFICWSYSRRAQEYTAGQ